MTDRRLDKQLTWCEEGESSVSRHQSTPPGRGWDWGSSLISSPCAHISTPPRTQLPPVGGVFVHSPFYTPLPRVKNPGAMFSKVLASVAVSGRDAEGVFHDELDDSACRAAEPKVNVGLASRLVVGHEVLVPRRSR